MILIIFFQCNVVNNRIDDYLEERMKNAVEKILISHQGINNQFVLYKALELSHNQKKCLRYIKDYSDVISEIIHNVNAFVERVTKDQINADIMRSRRKHLLVYHSIKVLRMEFKEEITFLSNEMLHSLSDYLFIKELISSLLHCEDEYFDSFWLYLTQI